MVETLTRQIDVVGLCYGTNGQSCTQHKVCGETVEVDDILKLCAEIVVTAGFQVAAFNAARKGGCKVGFLPKYMLSNYQQFENCQVWVTKLLRESENAVEEIFL